MQDSDDSRFKILFEIANDAIFIADADSGRLLDANARALRMIGRTIDEVRRMSFADVHPPEELDRLAALFHFERDAEGGGVTPCSLVRADGHIYPCEVSSRHFTHNGRRLAIGIFRDLSERVRALEDIHLRNVAIASVASGVAIADARQPDLPLIYVNRGFEQITGYSAKEAVGRSCRFLQGSDRDQAQLDILREALKRGDHCNVRLRNYRKDGTLFWNELHISPVRNERGELTHFVGIQLDVTDRVESRAALESSEARYRMLADNVEDMITRRSVAGRFDFVSPSCRRLLGYSPEALMLHEFNTLVHPLDRASVQASVHALLTHKQPVTHAFRIRGADGEHKWVESIDRLASHTGVECSEPMIVSVLRDITQRKRSEEEVRRALERERELNAIKTRFISLVTHEFKTPMTGIRASASFLREYGHSTTAEKRARHLRNIEQALNRMNAMLDDVLFVSRSESGKLPFNPRRLDIIAYCETLVEDMQTIFPQSCIQFSHTLNRAHTYYADPDLLTHVLQNLISNALKYSPQHTPVRFTVSDSGEDLLFEVADHGIGIPEADQADLFEPFQRAGNVGNISGTGLGLNIAKRAAERHGGLLSFTSKQGEGTTFYVRIPVGVEDSEADATVEP